MKLTQTFKLTTLALFTASLGACGGGGAEPAFTGGTSDPVVNTPVESVANKVTVTGNVMKAEAANAYITVNVGDKSFSSTVPSDANGAFSVEVDEGAPGDLVTIEAIERSTGLHLVTVSGSFEEVAAKGSNGTINGQDVSIITTASFALATALASDASVDSSEEYEDLLSEASSVDLANVATALQIVTTPSYQISIPNEYEDTLELAIDVAENNSNFLSDVNVLVPGTVENAKQALFSGEGFTQKFVESTDSGVYVSYDNFTLYALYESGKGSASFFDDGYPSQISEWNVNSDGDLVLNYSVVEDRRDQVKLLNSTRAKLQTLQQQTRVTQNSDVITPATFDHYKFSGEFFADTVPGSYSLSSVDATSLNLVEGGSGAWSDRHGNFRATALWAVDGQGRLVVTNSAGSQTIILTRLVGGQIESPVLMTSVAAGGGLQELNVVQFVAQ